MRIARFISLLAVISLAGCALLFRDEAPLRHYTLGTAAPQEVETADTELADLSIGLRRLRLADHLETQFIVLRRQNHQVQFSDHHRWAGELHRDINRAVARYLAARAPFERVDAAPWPNHAEHDYLIQIQVLRFEGLSPEPDAQNAEAHLLADWEIIRALDREVVARGTTDYRQPEWTVGDYAALVRMLDEGLRVLSDDLVDQLANLVTGESAPVDEL